jgi:AraC-like DNA-binding protein
MNYSHFIPAQNLQNVIECFWTVTGDDTEQQKIIPDGFPEIIFHLGDPYELIDENGIAACQEKILISGQICRPIMLRPTGISDVLGIKFKPAGVWKLLNIEMSSLRDRVLPLTFEPITEIYQTLSRLTAIGRISVVEEFLAERNHQPQSDELTKIIESIDNAKGNISIDTLCSSHNLPSRTLQRMFQQQVGLTAKQYSRIVRFRYVYSLLQKPLLTKNDSLFLSGYFDQPHFNREFREFTHETPAKWFSKTNAFSNLFMNR